jgi:hypothetical protein
MFVIPATLETEVVGSLEPMSWRQAWATQPGPVSKKEGREGEKKRGREGGGREERTEGRREEGKHLIAQEETALLFPPLLQGKCKRRLRLHQPGSLTEGSRGSIE